MSKNFFLFFSLLTLFSTSCRYSPWETQVPEKMQNLNNKNKIKLMYRDIPGDMYKVILISDTQRDPYATRKLIEIINKRNDLDQVAFMAILGDITDAGLLREYELIYQALEKLKIPYFGIVGNHDAISFGKDIFKEIFGAYNFTIGYKWAKFIAFNNNGLEFGNEVPDMDFIYRHSKAANPDDEYSHYIMMAHAPFYEGPVNTEEQRQETNRKYLEVKTKPSQWGIHHGVFGHVHRFSFEIHGEDTYMTVAKVDSSHLHYSTLEITKDEIKYYSCTPDCSLAKITPL